MQSYRDSFQTHRKVVCIFAFKFRHRPFQTAIIKLSQRSVSNLTLSADGKSRKQRLCAPVQVLSLYINVSPAWYNIIYVLYVSDQTVRQQQQKPQRQGDPVLSQNVDGWWIISQGIIRSACYLVIPLCMEHMGELKQTLLLPTIY